MEFTFHNSYVILDLVLSTVIFCADLSYSDKATLLLGWSHRYKNSTVAITIWLTVTKYPYLKWQWIFSLSLRLFFFPLEPSRLLPNLTVYMNNTTGSYKEELLTLREHLCSLQVFSGVRVAHLFSCLYCVVFLCFVCLRSVFYVPNVASVSGLSILGCSFGFI